MHANEMHELYDIRHKVSPSLGTVLTKPEFLGHPQMRRTYAQSQKEARSSTLSENLRDETANWDG